MAQVFPRAVIKALTTIPVHRDRATSRQQGRDGPRGDAAKTSPGTGYDLFTFFDCLHDMGDPVGAARHVCESLAPGGTWILVEPLANDRIVNNFTRWAASTARRPRYATVVGELPAGVHAHGPH
jgi:hypothetical protein